MVYICTYNSGNWIFVCMTYFLFLPSSFSPAPGFCFLRLFLSNMAFVSHSPPVRTPCIEWQQLIKLCSSLYGFSQNYSILRLFIFALLLLSLCVGTVYSQLCEMAFNTSTKLVFLKQVSQTCWNSLKYLVPSVSFFSINKSFHHGSHYDNLPIFMRT